MAALLDRIRALDLTSVQRTESFPESNQFYSSSTFLLLFLFRNNIHRPETKLSQQVALIIIVRTDKVYFPAGIIIISKKFYFHIALEIPVFIYNFSTA